MTVKEARQFRKMTQRELMDATGISPKEICDIETLKANPTIKTLRRIAKALDMQLIVDFVPIRRDR